MNGDILLPINGIRLSLDHKRFCCCDVLTGDECFRYCLVFVYVCLFVFMGDVAIIPISMMREEETYDKSLAYFLELHKPEA